MTESRDRLADALADRYLLEEALGRGATATVYLAQDVRHGRRVALKVLHAALGQALGVERFQREIRTQARLHHPHILPLFDSGSAAGQLYYVMPYVETGTLRERLIRQGPLSVPAAVQLGREVASALAYAHALGVVHRDLKPENIVFSPMGHAILADFGIAYAVDSAAAGAGGRLTETGVAVGTPVYMSPEQSAGDELVDGRTDQYSLAVVLYETFTLLPPFTGPNARAIFAQKLTESPPVILDRRADVPPALEQVLFRALERAREARYETIEEFSTALTEAARTPTRPHGERAVTAFRAQPAISADGAPGRPWRTAGLVAAVLLVLAGGGLAAWRFVASRAAAAAGPRVVAVLPFKNLGRRATSTSPTG
jgi:serine/threonine protein kinase